jgi:hypothetical protein
VKDKNLSKKQRSILFIFSGPSNPPSTAAARMARLEKARREKQSSEQLSPIEHANAMPEKWN